jgi:hypothetical protein
LETVEKRHSVQLSNIHAATRTSAGTFSREKAHPKRCVTAPATLDHNSNVVMTSIEIFHVALQYYAQFKFCKCSIACENLMKAILSSANNTILIMLRHDNVVEAESKTRYKVLRAVKIQGNNFDSKKSLLISGWFPRLE